MTRWIKLFSRPSDGDLRFWFSRIADQLLNRSMWLIAGEPHRLLDIEFYYQSPDHFDPFAHADPIQAEVGRWYFHRSYGVYRGGSFKGIDVTFGGDPARGGILIRGISTPQGKVIDGPSLVVDHILRVTKCSRVADLDAALATRRVWDRDAPLSIRSSQDLGLSPLICARVGLSMRRAQLPGSWADYLLKPYRFLSDPVSIRKGKSHMVIALHRAKVHSDEIPKTIGSRPHVVQRLIANYTRGLGSGRFEDYYGRVLTAKDICRLHGIADRCNQELPFFDSSSR